jgi:glycosyltransferase involved in cell wall biosynthesis
VCILPNQQRLECFVASIKVDPQRTICVWNCPRQDEVQPARDKTRKPLLSLYYHGSIGSHGLPKTILEAMAQCPNVVQRLDVVGYETIGTEGYLKQFQQYATKLRLDHLLHIYPPQTRHKLWGMMSSSSTGLAMVTGTDINLRMLVGASNKAFDYLAAGLSLIVPDTPDWQAMFVKPGYGLACNPDDTASLVNAFSWLAEHPVETYEMGELGRQRILEDWNYERQFAPVLDYLCSS